MTCMPLATLVCSWQVPAKKKPLSFEAFTRKSLDVATSAGRRPLSPLTPQPVVRSVSTHAMPRDSQQKVAEALLERIEASLQAQNPPQALPDFRAFSMQLLGPNSVSLLNQNVERLRSFFEEARTLPLPYRPVSVIADCRLLLARAPLTQFRCARRTWASSMAPMLLTSSSRRIG